MIPSNPLRAANVLIAFLGLSLLLVVPANAGKDVFTRNKPHVSMSASSAFSGAGTQARAKPSDPWSRRPRFRCVKPEGSAGVYCR
jgi:hypothetical protein